MQALRLWGKQNLLFIILLDIWTARKPSMTLNNVFTMKINLMGFLILSKNLHNLLSCYDPKYNKHFWQMCLSPIINSYSRKKYLLKLLK